MQPKTGPEKGSDWLEVKERRDRLDFIATTGAAGTDEVVTQADHVETC